MVEMERKKLEEEEQRREEEEWKKVEVVFLIDLNGGVKYLFPQSNCASTRIAVDQRGDAF